MSQLPYRKFLDRGTPPTTLTLTLLAGIGALNMSIFLPSLSAMTDYFQTDYAVMQLAVSGYLAATAVLQVFIGPLADRFGRRPVTLVSLAIFVIATLGTLVAPTAEVFLICRMAQAAVAAGMVLSRAIVRDMVPGDQAAALIAFVTMGMSLVPMIGPMIGGILAQFFGWQSNFVLLTISGGLVFFIAYRDLGETVRGNGVKFKDQFRSYPELLTSVRFWGYAGAAALSSGGFFALLGGTSFVADEVFGLSPFWAGIGLGSPAIGYAVGNGISARYSVRYGIDRMVLWGATISAIGLGLSLALSLAGFPHPLAFFGFCTFLGLGNGLVIPNATSGALSVRPHLAGTASGLAGAIMIGGGAVLSSLAVALLTSESGAIPLQVIMFASCSAAVVCILMVMRRARRLGL